MATCEISLFIVDGKDLNPNIITLENTNVKARNDKILSSKQFLIKIFLPFFKVKKKCRAEKVCTSVLRKLGFCLKRFCRIKLLLIE